LKKIGEQITINNLRNSNILGTHRVGSKDSAPFKLTMQDSISLERQSKVK